MNARPLRAVAAAATALILTFAVSAASRPPGGQSPQEASPIYEVRSYHIDPTSLADYRAWITGDGLAYLRRELDVVGFWIDEGVESEVRGETLDPMGPANVTWIIRWPSKAVRDERLPRIFGTPEWQEIFSRLPGGGATYLRIESRFLVGL